MKQNKQSCVIHQTTHTHLDSLVRLLPDLEDRRHTRNLQAYWLSAGLVHQCMPHLNQWKQWQLEFNLSDSEKSLQQNWARCVMNENSNTQFYSIPDSEKPSQCLVMCIKSHKCYQKEIIHGKAHISFKVSLRFYVIVLFHYLTRWLLQYFRMIWLFRVSQFPYSVPTIDCLFVLISRCTLYQYNTVLF